MAVQAEFLSVIVPIQKMVSIYPNGLDGYLHDHAKSIGRTVWYDQNIIRAGGTMDPDLVDDLILKWVMLGFHPTEQTEDGRTEWRDLCLVSSYGASDFQCPWIVVDGAKRIAWLRGTEMGDIVGREQQFR